MILSLNEVKWLKSQLKEVPGDSGWLQEENLQEFIGLAVELIEDGMDRYKAVELLTKAYWAVAQEFGL